MKRSIVFYAAVPVIIALAVLGGCQKKVTKTTPLPETPAAAVVAVPADTSDSASFNAATLRGELAQQAREALQNVYFDFDKSTIVAASEKQLQLIGRFLLDHPDLRVLVTGNCDERGSAEYNIGLGETRARVVKVFLTAYGIDANRIETTSYGKERPATSGCTDDTCHGKNRRGEFSVLQNSPGPVSVGQ